MWALLPITFISTSRKDFYVWSICQKMTWPWECIFGMFLLLARLKLSLISYIPYSANFRFNNRPDMLSVLACFLCHFGCYILKQKSLATYSLFGIMLIIKIPILIIDLKLIAEVCVHVNYPIIVMVDRL